jgi:UV DNA damage repair endonuclease
LGDNKAQLYEISIHPDQSVLKNAKDGGILTRSLEDLDCHVSVLDQLRPDEISKVQPHAMGSGGCEVANTISRMRDI